ncbi:T9SS sorting signal type C domain-containing protein [Flavobacterium azooxidireducens]|uniref:T9SS sorting signal type C domain-containing protein n=1 Tax=Flavobacterium azooxidireducens TaxID=1871076 RepID=A0ABY4KB00_9FLAO|nr:T9SS sorting signal type C domain-containing protein [Flavobacterium azooxidireducens]UPQ77975.1 T9SS sorting signal type C domain-containing protein [Flavobacterium azooxidireducens]
MRLKLYSLVITLSSILSYGQFFSSPPSIDGTIDSGYGIGTNGWAMGWDDTYLYLRKSTTGNEPVVIYLDVNPIVPVSGGNNSNGNLAGITHWGITPILPFRADFNIYWEDSYLQYQTANGSGGWNTAVAVGVSERTNAGGNKECRIPWSALTGSGRPSALNWLGYCNSRPGSGTAFIYHQVPDAALNPSGTVASPRFHGYYSIVNTTNSGTTNPFGANQISFETRAAYTFSASQPATVWDMTINAPSGTEDLLIERNVEIGNRLDIASPFSRFRATGGNRTITMSGSNGSIRNSGGTMFGEFSGNTMSLVVSGAVELFSSGNFIDFRNFTINNSAILIANTVQMSSNSGTGSFTVNGTLRTTRSNGLFGTNDFTIRSNNLNLTLGANSIIDYNALGNQNITTHSYANLVLSGSGLKTLANDTTITKDLTVSSGCQLTVNSGQNLTVVEDLIANDNVTIENNANLIQEGTINTNSGAISVKRNSASIMRLDYTLWSSPVANQNLLDFSPNTFTNRFYVYNPSTNQYNTIAPSTNDFEVGTGYLIRMPDDHPATPTVWNGEFNGVPNNGDVTVTVANDTYNAVGNPYPSTIDAEDFINTNSLTEAIYFWRKTNNATTSSYATFTLAGETGPEASEGDPLGLVPNGVIQVGQGFIVKSTSTSINFDNTMRIADNNNQFLRNSSEIENNRIRLTVTGANGFYSQVLVNYRSEATNDFDATLDGRYLNDSPNAFFTILNQEPFVIQARALPFENTDVVSLGFKTTTAGTFSIVLNQKDGVFTDNSEIFIKDNALGIWHNITTAPYEFVSEAGTFSERFELVYQEALSVDEALVNANSFIVLKENNGLTVRSAQEEIATVNVFDLSGRLIASSQNNSSTNVVIPLGTTQTQVLLLQVITQKGINLTKKVIY